MQIAAPSNKIANISSRFVSAYKSVGSKLTNKLEQTDVAILFGANLIENSDLANVAKDTIYMHPVQIEQNAKYLKYEAGSEEGVALLLLDALVNKSSLDSQLSNFIDELDIGYLSAESSISEEELEDLANLVSGSESVTLVVGSDIYTHESCENIAKVLATIAKFSSVKVSAIDANLETEQDSLDTKLTEPSQLPSYDGIVVYSVKSSANLLLGSSQFAMAAKVKDGDIVSFNINEKSYTKEFKLDKNLKGTIAINQTEDLEILSSYRFKRIQINKVGSENE